MVFMDAQNDDIQEVYFLNPLTPENTYFKISTQPLHPQFDAKCCANCHHCRQTSDQIHKENYVSARQSDGSSDQNKATPNAAYG